MVAKPVGFGIVSDPDVVSKICEILDSGKKEEEAKKSRPINYSNDKKGFAKRK